MIREWLTEAWARRLERCGDRLERWARWMILRADRCRVKSRQLSLDIEAADGRRRWGRM